MRFLGLEPGLHGAVSDLQNSHPATKAESNSEAPVGLEP